MESTIFQLPIAEIIVLQALEIWAGAFCLLLHSAINLKPVLKKVDLKKTHIYFRSYFLCLVLYFFFYLVNYLTSVRLLQGIKSEYSDSALTGVEVAII